MTKSAINVFVAEKSDADKDAGAPRIGLCSKLLDLS
jgi:hypothetical protein